MGFFSAFRSTSSTAKEFKKKFIELSQFLSDISYEPGKYSWQTIQAKKFAYMTEMAEMCRKASNPRDEAFNVYTNSEAMAYRLNMTSALVIAERYIEAVENGIKLSNRVTDQIINESIKTGTMFDYDCVLAKYCQY